MKFTYELTLQSSKTGKSLKRKKQFAAHSESEARSLAKEAGLIPIDVAVIDFWHSVQGVAGVSFKNPDNTSRYKVIRDCQVGDAVVLVHEQGNRHDKNAVRVLDSNGRQMGFLPRDVAESVMEWYMPGNSPIYSAVIDDIDVYESGARPILRLVVAAPSASDDKILEALAAEGVRAPAKHLPRSILESKPRVVPSRRETASDAHGSGCMPLLVVACFTCCTIVACVACLF